MFKLQTKFEISSFIRSNDMVWASKCRNGSRDPVHAHLGDSHASQGEYFARPNVHGFLYASLVSRSWWTVRVFLACACTRAGGSEGD